MTELEAAAKQALEAITEVVRDSSLRRVVRRDVDGFPTEWRITNAEREGLIEAAWAIKGLMNQQQRCTAEIHDGRYVGDSAIVQVSVCNLPIEGYGPCEECGNPYAPSGGRHHTREGDPIELTVGPEAHTYQPSQWRHVGYRGTSLDRVIDHEAKP